MVTGVTQCHHTAAGAERAFQVLSSHLKTQLFESFAPVLRYVCGVLGVCMCVYVRVYVACGCMHVYAYVCVWCMHMRLEVDFNILSNPPQFFSFSFFIY